MWYLVKLIDILFTIFYLAILGRVIFSWMRVSPANPLAKIAFMLTEPVLAPIRRVVPPMSGLDFSPLIAWFGAEVLRQLLTRILMGF
jgi:YggT family protein